MSELTDVVIVGGGVLGAALACELARRTLRVVLLEAGRMAGGASGSSFAWVNATWKTEDETYHRLNARGLDYYKTLAAEWGAETLGLHGGGALFWEEPDNTAACEILQRRAQRLNEWNYPVVTLDHGELRALEPGLSFSEGAQGMLAPADMWVDVPRLVRFFVESASRNGADVRMECAATGFTRSITGAISTVATPQGRIATRLLVLAAGLATPQLTVMASEDTDTLRFCPVYPEPGLLIETPNGSGAGLAHRVLYPPDSGGLHLRPTANGGLLLGANDLDAHLDSQLNARKESVSQKDAVKKILQRAQHWMPSLQVDALSDACLLRQGVRPIPKDGLPIVGPLPGVKGAYLLVAHSGVTLGPLLAKLLADEIVVGGATSLSAPYRPSRFA